MKLIFLFTVFASLAVRAELEIDVWGATKKLVGAYGEAQGSTEVTPCAALHEWKQTRWGVYWGFPYSIKRSVRRSVVTGQFFYTTKTLDAFTGEFVHSGEPFLLNSVMIRNWRCVPPGFPPGDEHNEVETFTVAAWVGQLKKSGFFPPGQPYAAWVKFLATKVPETCGQVTPTVRESKTRIALNDSGTSVVRPGLAGYEFAWPPLIWVGEFYEY